MSSTGQMEAESPSSDWSGQEWKAEAAAEVPVSLANTLWAVQQKRGALYMLETARYLIENWDLQSDQLDAQSDATRELVAKLLKMPPVVSIIPEAG